MSENKNKVEKLIAMKESLNEAIDKKIAAAKLDELKEGLSEKSFITLDNIFRGTSLRLSESKEGERLIRKYAKTIIGNKALSESYTLHRTIRNSKGVSNPAMFSEMIVEKISNIDKKSLNEGIRDLSGVVSECIGLSGMDLAELDEIIGRSEDTFNKAFTFLSENKHTTKNLVEWLDNFGKVAEYINENCVGSEAKPDMVDESRKENLLSLVENTMNEKEGEAWVNRVKNDVMMTELGGKDEKTLFESYKQECIGKIDALCENALVEEKARLEGMKKGILLKEYKEESFISDLVNMGELSEVLSSEKD